MTEVWRCEWIDPNTLELRVAYAYSPEEVREIVDVDGRGALVTTARCSEFESGLAAFFAKLSHPSGRAS